MDRKFYRLITEFLREKEQQVSPKETWRGSVEVERQRAGWNDWNTAKAVARDMVEWKQNVAALCPYSRKERR